MNALIMVGLGLSLVAPQKSGTDLLAKHVSTLQNANSISVVFTVQAIPSAPLEYRIDFSRPGMAKIVSPKGFVLTDGKTVWEYYKDTNEYAEYPGGLKEIMEQLSQDDIAPWASFFLKDQFKSVKDATVGKQTVVKGLKVIPVHFTVDASKSKTATFYLDATTGVAQGAAFKAARAGDSSEVIILAKEIKLGESELDNLVFAFEAPPGAKKVEYARHDLEKWYTNLDEALKAAKASNRMVFLDFGTEWCGACKWMAREVFPTAEFRAMAKYYVFCHIDGDAHRDLLQQFNVSAFPTMVFLTKEGKEVHRMVGAAPVNVLIAEMEKALQMAGG